MAYFFACTPAVDTRLGFCALAVRTDPLSGTTGAFHFAIFTIRAGNSAPLSGGGGVGRGWNGETLRAEFLPDIFPFFFCPISPPPRPPPSKHLLFFFSPTHHSTPPLSHP